MLHAPSTTGTGAVPAVSQQEKQQQTRSDRNQRGAASPHRSTTSSYNPCDAVYVVQRNHPFAPPTWTHILLCVGPRPPSPHHPHGADPKILVGLLVGPPTPRMGSVELRGMDCRRTDVTADPIGGSVVREGNNSK